MEKTNTILLNQIKKIIREREPGAKIYFYGSRSRGEAKKDSDLDLLILLPSNSTTSIMEHAIAYSLFDLEFDHGVVISPMIYMEDDWNTKYKHTLIYKNIMREARLL
ncbi:MAG: nucleotidyltransferase domain-containing protein [Bacteroidetes bacterium]|nr:nucleotidyltransferase domain-containing protein [Bacteroidota bacterium]